MRWYDVLAQLMPSLVRSFLDYTWFSITRFEDFFADFFFMILKKIIKFAHLHVYHLFFKDCFFLPLIFADFGQNWPLFRYHFLLSHSHTCFYYANGLLDFLGFFGHFFKFHFSSYHFCLICNIFLADVNLQK